LSLLPGTRLGPYEIVGQIGVGGMGEVWKAKDSRLGREVAVKVLPPGFADDPERLRRFESEAKALAALSHPNILAVHDVGKHRGSPYLVMELLEGETLRERLRGGALSVKRAVELALQIARGLATAHEKGLVHRDLKPANLFISRDGHLKILDFGLAKQAAFPLGSLGELSTQRASGFTAEDLTAQGLALGTVGHDSHDHALGKSPDAHSDPQALDLTSAGFAIGTAGYMSPEQVSGKPADARSDLFAFGVVLYEMLSGRRAFERGSAIETLSATLKEDPPELSSPSGPIPPTLQRIVGHCLEKDPGRRFQSVRDLAYDLESVLTESTSASGLTGSVPQRAASRFRPRALALAALVVLVGAGGLFFWKPWHRKGLPVHVPSLVALPAKVLGLQESAFLTDAIPDTLSTLLAGVEGLDTRVPPSSAQVEKLMGDLGKVAEAYQVEHLLLTTVTVQGENLILNVKLVEATTQKMQWAGQYEGTRSAYNALLREAAEALARALKPGLQGFATNAGPGTSSEFELALKEGQHYAGRYDTFYQLQDFERAREAYGRALKADPASAPALGNFAYLWIMRAWAGGPKGQAVGEAERLAQRALALDPSTGMAWAALAYAKSSNRPAVMEKVLEYSIKAANPHALQPDWGSSLAGAAGGPILMAAVGRRIFERNPLAVSDSGMAATGLNWQGKPEEALRLIEKILRIEPGFRYGLVAKSEALVALGRLEEAGRLLKRCEPGDSEQGWDAEMWRHIRFQLAVAQGDQTTAGALADRAVKLWLGANAQQFDGNAVSTMPPGLMRMGRREEALRMLERAMELSPQAEGYLWVLHHPELRPLRGDPRFEKLVEQGKKDAALAVKVLQAAKARSELAAFLDGPLVQLQELLKQP
jgi:serine/threonine protein kinase/tetratricopeptide (TPR) repeat protein